MEIGFMKVRDRGERLITYGILLVTLSSCGVKDKLTFFPDRTSTIPQKDIPSYASEHWIKTSDGETLQAFLFQHPEQDRSSLILYFHGNAGNLYHRFDHASRLRESAGLLNSDCVTRRKRGSEGNGSASEATGWVRI